MLEFTNIRDIVEAYNKGELKEGDHYMHKGIELVLERIHDRTVSCHNVGALPFKGSQSEKNATEILLNNP